MSRTAQTARLLAHAQTPDRRTASDEATALWSAACKLQDAGPLGGIDVGLALVVRDKLDALLEARHG